MKMCWFWLVMHRFWVVTWLAAFESSSIAWVVVIEFLDIYRSAMRTVLGHSDIMDVAILIIPGFFTIVTHQVTTLVIVVRQELSRFLAI